MKVKRGDKIKVIKGKDRSREGTVERVLPSVNKVVVGGVNVYKKHLKSRGGKEESGIIDVVKPVAVSNVMIICPKCVQMTRVGYKNIAGEKNRICKKCGENLDVPKKGKK